MEMKYFEANPYKIQVINNTILIKEIPEQELVNGLFIVKTENKRQFMAKGEVIQSAPCVKDSKGKVLYDLELKPKDKILYDNRAIQHRIKWDDEMYYVIRAEDAYCVVE